jgi:2-oxoglutarate ferredoxin oxidoreductase subunit delta
MTEKTKKGRIRINRERCKGCLLCREVCPTGSIEVDKTLNKTGYFAARFQQNPEEGKKGCIGCAQCATVCPEIAIEVYRAQ